MADDRRIKKVYVIGAGFSRAFNPSSPLQIDDYENVALVTKFLHLPHALALLEDERRNHRNGLINIEKLMSRTDELMPYDYARGAADEFTFLFIELKQRLLNRIRQTRAISETRAEINEFARHCLAESATCITFNYDDLLDEALYQVSNSDPRLPWDPTTGYGFTCHSSIQLVRRSSDSVPLQSRMQVLKLHGSINWRPKLGSPEPHSLDSVVHHEDWLSGFDNPKFLNVTDVEQHMESMPVIIPPILSKSGPISQPILRLVWRHAFQQLIEADEVIFIGYSLPANDSAARTLFSEALVDMPSSAIHVVGLCESEMEAMSFKLHYKTVLGRLDIPDHQFHLDGAIDWMKQLG